MLVRMDNVDNQDSKTLVEGSSYLRADAGSTHRAVSGAGALTKEVRILPTTFAPNGVVKVELQEASLTCTANGTASSAAAKFTAVVKVFTYNKANPVLSDYTTVILVKESDPVSSLNMNIQNPNLIQVGADPITNAPILLSQYIASWGSATGPASVSGTTPKRVQRDINGIVSITTKPVRAADLDSNIGISFGILACTAEDNR